MGILGDINIEFYVFTEYDPNVLLVADVSNWLTLQDKVANIEIILPGSHKPIVYRLKKGSVNSFNSHNLGVSCFKGDCGDEEYVELPDGVYTITLKGSPSTFQKTKYHLKTDQLQARIDKVLMDLGYIYEDSKKEIRKSLFNVQMTLTTAEAFIRQSEVRMAGEFYEIAQEELENVLKCID